MLLVIIAVAILLLIKLGSRLTLGRCKSPVCLNGKTALITGANSGIGYETALDLAKRGCRIIIADKDNCDESVNNIIKATGNNNVISKCFNLNSLSSVRNLAKNINETEERLDILINNAGAAGLGNSRTEDGLHLGMQVNHFGGFLLTHLLTALLKKSAPSRIVFVSSAAAYLSVLSATDLNWNTKKPGNLFSDWLIYSNSKLCNTITSNIFADKLKGTGVTSNCLHPGIVETAIFTRCFSLSSGLLGEIAHFLIYLILKLCSKNAREGAQTTIHLAVAKSVENTTGKYFMDCVSVIPPFFSRSRTFAKQIWDASENYVQLKSEEKL